VREDAVSLKEEVLDEAVQRHVVAEVPGAFAQREEQRVLQEVILAVKLVDVAKARTRTVYDNFLGMCIDFLGLRGNQADSTTRTGRRVVALAVPVVQSDAPLCSVGLGGLNKNCNLVDTVDEKVERAPGSCLEHNLRVDGS